MTTRETIIKTLGLSEHLSEGRLNYELIHAEVEIEHMPEDEQAAWLERVADQISGHMALGYRDAPKSVSFFTQMWRDDYAEARDSDLEEWKDDHETWVRWHPHGQETATGPVGHPWDGNGMKQGAEVVLRYFDQYTAVEAWRLRKVCERAAMDVLKDSLLDMVKDDESGSNVADAARKALEKECERIHARLLAEIKAEASKETPEGDLVA